MDLFSQSTQHNETPRTRAHPHTPAHLHVQSCAAPASEEDATFPPTRIGGVFIPLHSIIDGRCFDEWLEIEEKEGREGEEEEEEEGDDKQKRTSSEEDNDFEEGVSFAPTSSLPSPSTSSSVVY